MPEHHKNNINLPEKYKHEKSYFHISYETVTFIISFINSTLALLP